MKKRKRLIGGVNMRTIKKLSAMIMVFLFLISFYPMPMSFAKAAEISVTVYV